MCERNRVLLRQGPSVRPASEDRGRRRAAALCRPAGSARSALSRPRAARMAAALIGVLFEKVVLNAVARERLNARRMKEINRNSFFFYALLLFGIVDSLVFS